MGGIFDFLSRTPAEKSPTLRKLRSMGVTAGTSAADDFEVVLTALCESVTRSLKTEAGVELGAGDVAKLRAIIRENLDPKKAHTVEEGKRKQERLAEMRAEMQAALAGLRPQASSGGIDVAAMMAQMQAQSQQQMAAMQQLMAPVFAMLPALLGRVPPGASATQTPVPGASATQTPPPQPSADESAVFSATDL